MSEPKKREQWASRIGLVLAMAGNAVGLGNFLRFPAKAIQNGGGAFLIPYLVSFVVLGLPLMWIEWTMGRYGGQYGHHSTPGIFDSLGKRSFWKYFGVFGLWSNLVIAAYYLYLESWCLAYAGFSLMNGFSKRTPAEFFGDLTGINDSSIVAISGFGMAIFGICIAINIGILSRGLAKGIELVSKIGMPLLIGFAAVLAVRGLMISPATDPHAVASPMEGLNFVWQPNFRSLTNPSVWLEAAGQIFFTLSIGMGSMHCYASYLRRDDDVTLNGAAGAWTNEFCEIVLGGTILIPIAVAYLGMATVQKESGFHLGFMVFPTLFQHWGAFAPAAGFLWFGLLFFAAITSSLAMGQPIMAFLQDEFGWTRSKSALAFGAMLLPLSLPVAMMHSSSFFDEFDFWAGTFCLVVMSVGEAILFAWVFGADRGWAEMMRGADLKVPRVFYWIMKYVTPTFLIVILVTTVFKPAAGWDAYVSAAASGQSMPAWDWAADGMIGRLLHRDIPITADATPAQVEFAKSLKWARTADRLVMITAFLGFAFLVRTAWRRRKIEGK